VFTGPLLLYQIWAFITPGLRKNERKYTLVFVVASTILFVAGMALAYAVLSKGLRLLLQQAGSGTQAQLTVSDYISFVTLMLVVFGAAFELPLLVVMANFARVLPYRLLRRSRRVAIFLIFLFAAVVTPSTDPYTMLALAVPLCVLYEIAVAVARWNDKRRARREAESEFAGLSDDEASPLNIVHDPADHLASPEPAREPVERDRSAARVGGESDWDDGIT
jgi:sec-independent protein translocase protein TatC